jgi:hypothetical protein
MNIHLISFASPFKKYETTKNRFHYQALNLNIFNSISIFSELDCFEYSKELLDHKLFMETTKAYGFWIWKSFLISDLMKNIPNNDIVCYIDIGCTFNPQGLERMNEYVTMVNDNNSLCFELPHLEKEYTKKDTYDRIFPNEESHFHTGQRCATGYFLKNNQSNRLIMDEFKSISVENNYHYIDDSESISLNYKSFKDSHRFDQSIFSLLSKKYNFYCIPDETYWHPNWEVNGRDYPIWATRLK